MGSRVSDAEHLNPVKKCSVSVPWTMLALALVGVNLSTHKGDKGRPDLFTAAATYGAYA